MEVNMAIYYCGNTPTPWGDWGESLIHGTLARNEKTGERSIERVGPFTPAAYISYGSLIFTHPAEEALKSSNLNGIDRYEFLKKLGLYASSGSIGTQKSQSLTIWI